MRIEALTTRPAQLVAAIDKAVTDGTLKTWRVVKDSSGNLFYTHTPEQWDAKAFIGRLAKSDRVSFTITSSSGTTETAVKGYYAGRFTEILLVHFSKDFSKLETFS